ncbi:hypothetical protein P691DRAFT_100329 [Macrolepiota fuliginosa MF-IS2]|uniref:Uncharacterized protein n=1 Tax=Macrolepiota fuliginosa MF-IS2 TaxID=1400762 RepID=A0A9P6C639_9AGAR|nr:hypothetical protein P691DRAFT_100329 [Macrolepiota fuliginosa MF-IS2]
MESLERYIPQEIVELIIQFAAVDGWALPNLCLVSSRFLIGSQKHLYRRIDFIEPRFWGGRPLEDIWKVSVEQGLLFLITITRLNPSLAQHLRIFYFNPSFQFRDRIFWEFINRGLRVMTNLKTLIFTSVESSGMPRMRTLLWKCRFQLEEFRWNDFKFRDPKGDLAFFLSFQPELKVLSIISYDSLPPHVCPKLEKVIGYRKSVENMLLGRSVTRLEWLARADWWDQHRDKPPDEITKELSQLTSLIYGGYHIQRSGLELVIPHLKSLEVLHLVGFYSEYEFAHLVKLEKLRVFIWTSAYPGDDQQSRLEVLTPGVPGLFRNMKNLHSVYVNHCGGRHTPKNYLYWTSADVEAVTVDPPMHLFDWPSG